MRCVRWTPFLCPQPSATVRNRSQPFAWQKVAVPIGKVAKGVMFGCFKCCIASFRVAGVALCDMWLRHFLTCGCATIEALHTPLHTTHSTLYTLHSTLYTPRPTPNFTLHTLHSTLHTLHSTLHTPHFTSFYTLHSTLYTPHTHTTLHTCSGIFR